MLPCFRPLASRANWAGLPAGARLCRRPEPARARLCPPEPAEGHRRPPEPAGAGRRPPKAHRRPPKAGSGCSLRFWSWFRAIPVAKRHQLRPPHPNRPWPGPLSHGERPAHRVPHPVHRFASRSANNSRPGAPARGAKRPGGSRGARGRAVVTGPLRQTENLARKTQHGRGNRRKGR